MNIANDMNLIGKLTFDDTGVFTPKPTVATEKNVNAFSEALSSALSIFNEANELQKTADVAQLDFATGKSNDMLSMLMAEQKATSSLEFTVQMTNKVIEAYREIMRIQL